MSFDAQEIAWEAAEHGDDVLATTVGQALGYASACWENLSGAGVFKSDECREALDSLVDWLRGEIREHERNSALLGLATTGELLDELRARVNLDYFVGGGGLGYTTVGGRPDGTALPDGGLLMVADGEPCPVEAHQHLSGEVGGNPAVRPATLRHGGVTTATIVPAAR